MITLRTPSGKLHSILLLLAGALLLSACEPQADGQDSVQQEVVRPAKIETLQRASISGLDLAGTVRAAQRAEMAFKVAGRVDKVLVDEGDRVKQGDELARLDDREFRTALSSARAEYATADADYRRGLAIFERSQAISRRDLEKLETQRSLMANRLRNAELVLEETVLRAPFDGIVGRKLVEEFGRVGANQPVVIVQNLDELEVVIQVPDRVVLHSSTSPEVFAEIPGLDQTFPLNLKFYSTEADPVTQTYQVILGLGDKGDARILPGMSARVFSEAATSDSLWVSVPLGAIISNNQGQQYVWKLDADSRARMQPVAVGSLQGNRVMVTEGLQPGDQIITAGLSGLKDGMPVRPLETNGEAR
jgi:RND family efflux transporter MFP subunit